MMMLTPDQLQAIDRHLQAFLHETKWPYQGQFLDELTDHYTHSIQERMSKGETFDLALENTYDGFGQSKGIKSLEMNYWRLHARNFRWRFLRQMLSYFAIPKLFITLPLIGLLLAVKVSGVSMNLFSHPTWIPHLYSYYIALLIGTNVLGLVAWIFRVRSRRVGPLQQFFQRIERPVMRIAGWLHFVFMVEIASNPLTVGGASPYIATFLYVAGITIHFSWLSIKPPKAVLE